MSIYLSVHCCFLSFFFLFSLFSNSNAVFSPSACRSGVSVVCVQQCIAVWTDNLILATWSEAIVIPVLNLDRKHFLTSSYRPLIRFVCKTMERM